MLDDLEPRGIPTEDSGIVAAAQPRERGDDNDWIRLLVAQESAIWSEIVHCP